LGGGATTTTASAGGGFLSGIFSGIGDFLGGLFGAAKGAVNIRRFASGVSSIIPGNRSGRDDQVLAMLDGKEPIRVSGGESILSRPVTQVLGDYGLNQANQGNFAPLAAAAASASRRMIATSRSAGDRGTGTGRGAAAGNNTPAAVNYDGRVTVANFTDKQAFENYLLSTAGQRTVVNVIGKNSRSVRQYF
jgi:hypothetical protein